MANYSYGGGGNYFDPKTLLEGATALGQAFFGSPEMALQNRRLQISEQGAGQKGTQFRAQQTLGDIVSQGLPQQDVKGRYQMSPQAAGNAALAGELPAYSGLIRGMNEGVNQDIENESKLQLGLLNAPSLNRDLYYYGLNRGQGQGFQDYEAARAYARQQLAQDTVLDNQRKLDYETQKAQLLGGIFDVNHAPYAAAMRIYNDPNTPQPEKDKQIELLRSFLSASSGHIDPEAKAKAEVHQQQLMLETGYTPPANGQPSIQQGLQKIKTDASIAEIIAKDVSAMTYPSSSTPTGRQAILMDAHGMTPEQQLKFSTDEEIRKDAAKREQIMSGAPSPDTAEGAKYFALRKAGYTDKEAAAAMVGALSIPKGATVAAMPGDPRLSSFTQASRGQTAKEVLSLLKDEEMAAMPADKLRMLVKAAEEQASGKPGAGALPPGTYSSGGTIWSNEYKTVPQKQNAELTNHVEALRAINGAIDAAKKNKGAFGYVEGASPKVPVVGKAIQEWWLPKNGYETRAEVFDPVAIKRHAMFGGQLTSGETFTSEDFLPGSTDNASAVIQKLSAYKKATERQIEGLLNIYNPAKGFSNPDAADEAWKLIEPSIKQRAVQKNKGAK